MNQKYQEIALKIIPYRRFSKLDAREQIASAIQREVDAAIQNYKANSLSADIKKLITDNLEREAALRAEKIHIDKVIKGHLNLLKAVEKYLEWIDGQGEHEDLNVHWQSVRQAWADYKSL